MPFQGVAREHRESQKLAESLPAAPAIDLAMLMQLAPCAFDDNTVNGAQALSGVNLILVSSSASNNGIDGLSNHGSLAAAIGAAFNENDFDSACDEGALNLSQVTECGTDVDASGSRVDIDNDCGAINARRGLAVPAAHATPMLAVLKMRVFVAAPALFK